MSISAWIDQLPIENWAALVGRAGRRVRRRVSRRPLRAALSLAAVVGAVTIVSNALWEQSDRHPAPLFAGTEVASEGQSDTPLVAAHAPARAVVERPDEGLVLQVQEGLLSAGFLDGDADGVLDDRTADAIRKFEAYQGLDLTGKPTLTLVAAVGEVVRASPVPDTEDTLPVAEPEELAAVAPVQVAAPVATVPEIQAALNKHGFGPVSVDGVMGPQTQAALDRFSDARGLRGKGITPALLRALAEAPR